MHLYLHSGTYLTTSEEVEHEDDIQNGGITGKYDYRQ